MTPHVLDAVVLQLARDFPNAAGRVFEVNTTSPPACNCCGFALGILDRRIWPGGLRGDWWPAGVPHLATPVGFGALFAKRGFVLCPSGDPEPDTLKLALYLNRHGLATHVARSDGTGLWLSKVGSGPVVRHELEALEGAEFGRVERFYRRLGVETPRP